MSFVDVNEDIRRTPDFLFKSRNNLMLTALNLERIREIQANEDFLIDGREISA
jgi:hypothetical protein